MFSKQRIPREIFQIALFGIGLASVASVFYLTSPYIVIGGWRPFDNTAVRAIAAGLLCAAITSIALWRLRKRLSNASALAEGLTAQEAPDDDSEVLAGRIKDALVNLKKLNGGKATFLYDLPWYVIIGPPGSGKTTALSNSGLKFPLTGGAAPASLAGVGGTRYCDWWFTEDAILIDTAGRYTTQDSDAGADKRSWFAFLDLLKKNRPRQPINGVLVVISLEDMLRLGADELAMHARAIRMRLLELHERLKVDFPVYALFTKGDLIAGFTEYFGNLDEQGRRQVWGATFQTAEKSRNLVAQTPAEFDALIGRLNQEIPDRLEEEPIPSTRASLYGFPAQMATLKRPLYDFLNAIFEPTRYQSNANLRGFYFSSGTQHGTSIDRLINALVKNVGAQETGAALYSGSGKSYFLYDLIQNVIIGEAAWVSTDARAFRMALALKATLFGLIFAATAAGAAIWLMSYSRNQALTASVDSMAKEYVAHPNYQLVREQTASDRDFNKILPLLQMLRDSPTGYNLREAPPWTEDFGLSQRERLSSASRAAYRQGLEKLLRPRLLYRLEEVLDSHRNEPDYLYEALKVYMMLGGMHALDRGVVLAWERRDWATEVYQEAGPQEQGSKALEEHLLALFDLEGDGEPTVEASASIVEQSQRALARLSVAERAYQLLKANASSPNIPDWTAARAGGAEFEQVFESDGTVEPASIRVPGFYTYSGFHSVFLAGLSDIAEKVNGERWVLGKFAEENIIANQYRSLTSDLFDAYSKEFVAAWRAGLAKLRIKPLTGDKPHYAALGAASTAASPIKALFESIGDETMLTKAHGAEIDGAPSLGAQAAPSPPTVFANRDQSTGAKIEAQFRHYHEWVEDGASRKPIDELLTQLSEIRDNLITLATAPADALQANAQLAPRLQKLKTTASRLPDPFKDMLLATATAFEKDVQNGEMERLSRALGDQVTGLCQQLVTDRYPFVRSASAEITLADFGRLFAPGGVLDSFFKQNLAKYADLSKKDWRWRADLSRSTGLSVATLREFQQATQIRDAFFPAGGHSPMINLQIVPPVLSGDGVSAKLDINGASILTQSGASVSPQAVRWPGPPSAGRAAVTLLVTRGEDYLAAAPQTQGRTQRQPIQSTPVATIERTGAWSLFRLLDNARAAKTGDRLVASFILGGRELQYSFTVGSALNPFTLSALHEFRCPTGM